MSKGAISFKHHKKLKGKNHSKKRIHKGDNK